ncbi:RsmB/NOP family class I SAM-dependent RNA methyltransferase [Kitasatospora mediocidica]|uniref:RsmB/NOP family class I SAM-dependent RNA methyltransferase n=1 Tax=Kitasatospora mediocidica TaxID=58352 RepID=UPI00055EC863|nr:transcription antitermination factor NusB [Kitasatospora mediocidica]
MSTPAPSAKRPPRPHRRPKKDPARLVAFKALRAVDERDAYANLILPSLLREAEQKGMERRDAALATELVYGTLRLQGSYDAIIAACIDRPLREVDPPVLDVLSLGAHQLLATRIPSHAAVSATVELARAVLGDGKAKFVNAVLRRISAKDLDTWIAQVAPPFEKDAEDHLAVVHSHPRWVVSSLWDSLGRWQPDACGRADIEELLRADNERPEVTLVARPGRATAAELAEALPESEPGRWSPYAVRLAEGGDPGELDVIKENRVGVQDEGSQLVALALAAAPIDGSDRLWLDGCAGPGGKAALLGALAAERGAALVASEKQPHRARLVARALDGNPGPYTVIAADGTRPAWRPGSFDRALVDVPCSGLGALRRRPEARWRRRPEDIAGFGQLQRDLLRSAIESVRVGGVIGYATCSPHLAETRAVVDDVLRGDVALEWIDARPLLPGVPALGAGPDVQLWPHLHSTDAMYLALLRRTS